MSIASMRRVAAAALIIALLVVGAFVLPSGASATPSASPSPYPPSPGCAVSTSDSGVAPGATLHIIGSGFAAGATVQLSFGGASLGTVRTDANGSFTTAVTIPASVSANQRIVASAASTTCSFDPFGTSGEIAQRDTGGSTGSTGVRVATFVGIAVVLLGSGLTLLLVARRRRLS